MAFVQLFNLTAQNHRIKCLNLLDALHLSLHPLMHASVLQLAPSP